MTDWTALRQAAFDRSGGRCEFCGKSYARQGFQLHHRKLRSQGGPHTLDNLAAVHPACHERAHHYPALAREFGWIVPSWADPAEVQMRVPGK